MQPCCCLLPAGLLQPAGWEGRSGGRWEVFPALHCLGLPQRDGGQHHTRGGRSLLATAYTGIHKVYTSIQWLYAGIYKYIHKYTQVYSGCTQVHTSIYTGIHKYTLLYTGTHKYIHMYTQVYIGCTQVYTSVYTSIRVYTQIYTGITSIHWLYTGIHKYTLVVHRYTMT